MYIYLCICIYLQVYIDIYIYVIEYLSISKNSFIYLGVSLIYKDNVPKINFY